MIRVVRSGHFKQPLYTIAFEAWLLGISPVTLHRYAVFDSIKTTTILRLVGNEKWG